MDNDKGPKFLIAHNPMARPGEIYVYHARKPRFLALRTGSAFTVVDDIDDMLDYFNNREDKVEGLLRRLNDWFIAYSAHQKQ
ncbi:MAG TPA: hypothetical protein PKY29_04445 [Ferruginibacter sp.]|nr:hypothetical protein [Ferruginibacter sp.]HRQ20538.1 hypothetical protein [Ferruginibacter sp.]